MKIQIEIPIRDYVKSLMKIRGYRQVKLAKLSGVTPAAISFYFSEKRDIQVSTLEKILKVLK